jgi:twitching motility protein PilT
MFSESIIAVITQNLLKKADGKGRIAALEIMVGTPAVRNLIREGKVAQIPGMMQTMDATLVDMYKRGVVTRECVTPYLTNPSALSAFGVEEM